MEFVVTTISGFILGILASWTFWIYLRWQKPNVELATNMAVETLPSNGKKIYRFKVLNHGKGQVTDITLNAWVVKLRTVPSGVVTQALFELPLPNSPTITLSSKHKSSRPWGLTEELVIGTTPDFDILEMLKKDNHRVLVTLRCSDAVSGTTVVQQTTFTKKQIISGSFSAGSEMSVKKL